jgi:hypothetical protein
MEENLTRHTSMKAKAIHNGLMSELHQDEMENELL